MGVHFPTLALLLSALDTRVEFKHFSILFGLKNQRVGPALWLDGLAGKYARGQARGP